MFFKACDVYMQFLAFATSATNDLHTTVVHDSWKRQKSKIFSLPCAVVHKGARQELYSEILSGSIL